jgi:hypothetical protein
LHESDRPLRIYLCENAVSNNDGTFTIVRGGIEHWTTALPFHCRFMVFVEIPANTIGLTPATLELRLERDRVTIGGAFGHVVSSAPQNVMYLAVPVDTIIDKYGLISVTVKVGETLSAEAPLDVRPLSLPAVHVAISGPATQ